MAAAAVTESKISGWCNMYIFTKHHQCPHSLGGKCKGGSTNVFINGKNVQLVNDVVELEGCQHGSDQGFSQTGSATVQINGRAVVRIGDTGFCPVCGQHFSHVTGSSNVFVG